MVNIPQDLLAEYQRGHILLFIGRRIDREEYSQLGVVLAEILQEVSLADLFSPDEIAEEYQQENLLIRTVRDFYEQRSDVYQKYQVFASLKNIDVFVTTCIDERIEQAFEQEGRKLDPIISPVDIAYAGTTRLYKLHGTLSQPETLRLKQHDIQKLYYNRSGLLSILTGEFAKNTILFIGFALDDPFFQQLYGMSIEMLDRHARGAFALGGPYSKQVEHFCKYHHITLIDNDPVDFLTTFLKKVEDHPSSPISSKKTGVRSLQKDTPPYKKLLAYTPEDENLFFGRQRELDELVSLIWGHRLVVLHGPSGIGKSSLLGAGVVPYLKAEGHTVIMLEIGSKESLAALICHEMAVYLPKDAVLSPVLPLVEYLSRVTELLNTPVVFLLDQFEDFFIHFDPKARLSFTKELAQTLAQRDVSVKWVLSLRSEWFSELSEMKNDIRDIFRVEFNLQALDTRAIHEAIEKPLQNVNMSVEPELIERLVQDLGPETIQLPQLQLVCDTLYHAARKTGKTRLQLTQYTAKEMGGAKGILATYLNNALKRFPIQQRTKILNLLDAFVTSKGIPVPLTLTELTEKTSIQQEELLPLLNDLQDERLLSLVESNIEQPFTYQLAHNYLAEMLAKDPELRKQKAIRELLQQEVQDWRDEELCSLMSREKLAFLRSQQPEIELSTEEQELIFRSALQTGDDIEYWVKRIESEEICARVITEHLTPGSLSAPRPLAALSALSYLTNTNQFKPLLAKIAFNASIEAEVRHEAARHLASLDRDAFITSIESVLNASPERRQIILEAINNVWQVGVEAVSGRLARFKLKRPLRQLRLKHHRFQRNKIALYAAFGGACGAVLGGPLGLILSGVPRDYAEFAIFMPGLTGFFIGLGIGLGLGTVEAMGERANSVFYIMSVACAGGIPGVLYGMLGSSLSNPLLGGLFGLFYGMVGGINVAVIINLTRNIVFPTRRLMMRFLLCMALGVINGLISAFWIRSGFFFYTNEQGIDVSFGAVYGFWIGFFVPGCIAIGIEWAERSLRQSNPKEKTGRE